MQPDPPKKKKYVLKQSKPDSQQQQSKNKILYVQKNQKTRKQDAYNVLRKSQSQITNASQQVQFSGYREQKWQSKVQYKLRRQPRQPRQSRQPRQPRQPRIQNRRDQQRQPRKTEYYTKNQGWQKRKQNKRNQQNSISQNKNIKEQQAAEQTIIVESKKCNIPQNIINNSRLIPDIGRQNELRKIKKIFAQTCIDAEEIKFMYSLSHPIMFIEYKNKGLIQYMLIRDLKKANKKFEKERELIETFYSFLFKSVEPKFHGLKKFAIKKAEEKRIRINQHSLKLSSNETMFYFVKEKSQSPINFVIFDKFLNSVDFDDEYIFKQKKYFEQQFNLFKKFKAAVKCQEDDQQNEQIDFMGIEQLQSDQEDYKNRKDVDVKTMLKRLNTIMKKDVSELEDKIAEVDEHFNEIVKKSSQSTQYIEKVGDQLAQLQTLLQNFEEAKKKAQLNLQATSEKDPGFKKVVSLNLKKMIIAQKQLDTKLPILTRKKEIFELLQKNNLIILEGETGSGKSTQLPQMLCEYYEIFDNPNAKPVLVTQPRRLATRSLAERVAFQMQQQVRGFVDYAASIDRQINPDAKIIFKLDRLVLDELTVDPILSKYSCMVIDEAHERTISIDVILGLVKQLLTRRKDFKIIVTSASMDTKLFADYFNTKILKVSGRLFPVDILYRDYKDEQTTQDKIYRVITKDVLNDNMTIKNKYKGNILVFCCGVDQIERLCNRFRGQLNPNIFKIYALHGKIDPKQQKQVFVNTKEHKLIFASRIAQTAITIDGVTVVVDPGEDRQMIYDQKSKMSSMKLLKISQSSSKQRAGRAGRTKAGFCFRLYSEQTFNSNRKNKIPEIENMALDTLVLRLKSLDIKDVLGFPYITAPKKQGLEISIETMKMIGCLDGKQNITAIGSLLVKIPIQPFLARSIAEALIFKHIQKDIKFWEKINNKKLMDFDIVKSVIEILGMVINSSNLFYVSKLDRQTCERIKFKEFSNQDGDFFFFKNIFQNFIRLFTLKRKDQLRKWIRDHFLNTKALHQVRQLVGQITAIIDKFPIRYEDLQREIVNSKSKIRSCQNQDKMTLSCLVSSFCANLCLFSGNSDLGYTLISQRKPIQIYGTSNLSLQGINPKWIVCYDMIRTQQGRDCCKVSHAVDFEFLECHVDDYIFEKFNLEQAKDINLFYVHKTFNVPTLILRSLIHQFRYSENKNIEFLKFTSAFFYEDLNRVDYYYLKGLEKITQSIINSNDKTPDEFIAEQEKNLKIQKELGEILEQYIKKKQNSWIERYRHNYIGNIFIYFSDGCEIIDLDLINTQAIYSMDAPYYIIQYIQVYCFQYVRIQYFTEGNFTRKINCLIDDPEATQNFQLFLQKLKQYYPDFRQCKVEKKIVDKRRKIPQAKIFLKFFAGTTSKHNVLISYNNYQKQKTQQMLNCINKGLQKSQDRNFIVLRKCYRISLTKNGNGINLIPQNKEDRYIKRQNQRRNQDLIADLNEIDIQEVLAQMKKDALAGYNFQLPTSIRKFRDPQAPYCFYTNKEWDEKIKALLRTIPNFDEINTTIRVWGSFERAKDGSKQNQRINMGAQIRTFKLNFLQNFKDKYDGKSKVLGAQKLHCKFQFQQIIAIPHEKIFNYLKEQYEHLVMGFKAEYPLISFTQQEMVTKKGKRFYIRARSCNREDLLKPGRIIGKLFTPKFIKLQPSQFKFIDRSNFGADLLDNIERMYWYKICFGMEKSTSSLKLYCIDSIQKQITDVLLTQLKQFKFFYERISYKGKNLHKVQEILEQYKKQIDERKKNKSKSDQHLDYAVIFHSRMVQITADVTTFETVKNRILKLVSLDKAQCQICSDIIQRPYRLFTCRHSFCWLCLASYLREFKTNQNQALLCPNFECKKKINIYDVKTILNFEQFQKFCDVRTSKYVQSNNRFHHCFSQNCEQIFQQKQTAQNKSFECDLCGKWYCYECKQSHKNYSCKQWLAQKESIPDAELKILGIKKCPTCKVGIQKNEGCQHITCTACKTHICWNCLKVFETAKKCYDHLADQCGGIFPAVM